MPVTTATGERIEITEPGVYDLTDADYHADPVKGGSLSSTGARTILPPSCPARFRHDLEHGRADTAAFDYGRGAHGHVLGTGAPIAVIDANDWRTTAARKAARTARAEGATPLLRKDADRVYAMADALRAHPVAGPLFARAGVAEQSFVWVDEESGVWCRARTDWMPDVGVAGRVLVVDYKSTRDASPAGFAASMAKYGYHQQGPFYCDAIRGLGLHHDQDPQFVLVAQEKDPPFLVTVATPSPRAVEWGAVLNRKARDLYRACVEADHWPGYSDTIAVLDIPGWLDHQYTAAAEAGLYDTVLDDTIGDLA